MAPMILERLRAETAAVHRELEDEVQMERVAADPVRYQRLLEKFYGFHRAMEVALEKVPGWSEAPHNPPARSKVGWLHADLRALGRAQGEIERLPLPTALPQLESSAAAYGSAYVLEGSTLGGRHIAHLLEKGPVADLPRRFFEGYGAETGARWKAFCEALNTYAAAHTEAEQEAILRAAADTFTTFRTWLREP